ncbi:MAG: hypothetical protein UY41_C0027G0010 [Candidatus Moranbacteria bacterium GW2011_GWE1_49_15]|nr:MAG: hypothetical protein UY41_C0027G0010 [Candidatus Moranbacteria bacterium GW2011_GWE1_49_15]HBP00626.1 hypothetical protein [Candidatus Moranbacteria bacterium]
MKKGLVRIIFNVGVVSAVVVLLFLLLKNSGGYPQKIAEQESVRDEQEEVRQIPDLEDEGGGERPVEAVSEPAVREPIAENQNPLLDVPFVLQAPFANWDDPLFQDACEEAAILMASGWLEGKGSFTKQQMSDEIKKIAAIEDEVLSEHIDASAQDTAEILKRYAKGGNVSVRNDATLAEIKNELFSGNLVIVPTNGRKLGNPNYTSPGPVTHMIVIVGYDGAKKEFITNDSGTRNGEGYRYGENVLFGAVRDYPTGNHYEKPIDESVIERNMIVVGRE